MAVRNSTATWDGSMSFIGDAAVNGGALFAHSAAEVRCIGGETTKISNNSATHSGGGMFLGFSSRVSWVGEMEITNNTAEWSGGAITASFSSEVSWAGTTTSTSFSFNSAGVGGAFFVTVSSGVSWSAGGRTTLTGNSATASGSRGAVF